MELLVKVEAQHYLEGQLKLRDILPTTADGFRKAIGLASFLSELGKERSDGGKAPWG